MPARSPRPVSRAAIAVAVAALLGAALFVGLRTSLGLAALTAWDVGGATLLALAFWTIAETRGAAVARRAASVDPGQTAVYAIVLLTAGASLVGTNALLGPARQVEGPEGRALVALCLVNVAICWALTHTAFALRYAHLYYREDAEGVGGVEFPGGRPPDYFDFAYLAFTIGMTFQVSDTGVSSPRIRREVLLQGVLSFVYNTAILAFVLNLVFGAGR